MLQIVQGVPIHITPDKKCPHLPKSSPAFKRYRFQLSDFKRVDPSAPRWLGLACAMLLHLGASFGTGPASHRKITRKGDRDALEKDNNEKEHPLGAAARARIACGELLDSA
jgi:hypothetical protein